MIVTNQMIPLPAINVTESLLSQTFLRNANEYDFVIAPRVELTSCFASIKGRYNEIKEHYDLFADYLGKQPDYSPYKAMKVKKDLEEEPTQEDIDTYGLDEQDMAILLEDTNIADIVHYIDNLAYRYVNAREDSNRASKSLHTEQIAIYYTDDGDPVMASALQVDDSLSAAETAELQEEAAKCVRQLIEMSRHKGAYLLDVLFLRAVYLAQRNRARLKDNFIAEHLHILFSKDKVSYWNLADSKGAPRGKESFIKAVSYINNEGGYSKEIINIFDKLMYICNRAKIRLVDEDMSKFMTDMPESLMHNVPKNEDVLEALKQMELADKVREETTPNIDMWSIAMAHMEAIEDMMYTYKDNDTKEIIDVIVNERPLMSLEDVYGVLQYASKVPNSMNINGFTLPSIDSFSFINGFLALGSINDRIPLTFILDGICGERGQRYYITETGMAIPQFIDNIPTSFKVALFERLQNDISNEVIPESMGDDWVMLS